MDGRAADGAANVDDVDEVADAGDADEADSAAVVPGLASLITGRGRRGGAPTHFFFPSLKPHLFS